eukprot:TRINITY_DN36715_c0_g1_i2.p1 TRINITY_DN36715_c0_g1~~TRINITY_DN36715_c0_g1_i2.p1  ORF type:complete len:211 (+),score=19.03 TRINITY_DN36715_c0_g1_i2:114-746(+)
MTLLSRRLQRCRFFSALFLVKASASAVQYNDFGEEIIAKTDSEPSETNEAPGDQSGDTYDTVLSDYPRDAFAIAKFPPTSSCPTCCRGASVSCAFGSGSDDPCSLLGASTCTGYHRCDGAVRGFQQCQLKPKSTECQTAVNCLPECTGSQVGAEGDDCMLQPVDSCEGRYVVGNDRTSATQCRLKVSSRTLLANPSGAPYCEADHLCGLR